MMMIIMMILITSTKDDDYNNDNNDDNNDDRNHLHQRCSVLHQEKPSLPIMQEDELEFFIGAHL